MSVRAAARRLRREDDRPDHVVLEGVVHGYLSGATPTKVVWLDERQQPPSLFDLEAVVDLVRPAPARLREAAATTCRGRESDLDRGYA